MSAKIQPAIVGASGYAGFELARILLRHPRTKAPLLYSREGSEKASTLNDLYPHIAGNGQYPLEPFSWDALKQKGVDALLLATPHEISRAWVPEAEQRGVRVVDLSGAWRLNNTEHRAVYGFDESNEDAAERLMRKTVYGLPELHRQNLPGAEIVANPGCYSTSVILGLAPVVKSGLANLERGIICDSKSGVSGAGKQPTQKTHFVEVADNLSAYSVFAHRHTGEIVEQLGVTDEQITFTPHLLPIPRGILSTLYVRLCEKTTVDGLVQLYREFYRDSPFVRVFPPGKLPQIQFSLYTNYCDLGLALAPDGHRLIVVSCLDNLLKGAAGQAVQNLNVMYGFGEREGLS